MASANRVRVTGRDEETGCGSNAEDTCDDVDGCGWNSTLEYCLGDQQPYYTNVCLKVQVSSDLLFDNLELHHCTSAGLHCDQCDNTTISNNLVYGNTWWTTTATSGIVFANSQGTGTNSMIGNVVYGNRNFLPFFVTTYIEHFGSGVENYGLWNMASIVDGQGVYITRNTDYEGEFFLRDNIAFDNGINGLVVHKSTHENVYTEVENNRVFDNGRSDLALEGRQQAGGLTVNSGDTSTISN